MLAASHLLQRVTLMLVLFWSLHLPLDCAAGWLLDTFYWPRGGERLLALTLLSALHWPWEEQQKLPVFRLMD